MEGQQGRHRDGSSAGSGKDAGSPKAGPASCEPPARRPALAGRPLKNLLACLCLGVVSVLMTAGCGETIPSSSAQDLKTFNNAGPVRLQADLGQFLETRALRGPYCLSPGDVVEVQMPAILRRLPNRSRDETAPYRCRVDSAGKIILPIIGEVPVAGRTLPQIEAILANLYHPKYVRQKPSIVATVAEYRTARVSIVGAVTEPGEQELRNNELTLISALAKAGGISEEGASAIRVFRAGQTAAISVPVVGLTLPVEDVDLADGDTIIVEACEPEIITIVGLVNKPGLLPCSPRQKYSVMDALAFAGGINDIADPQYVKIYRQDDKGNVVYVVLRLNDSLAVGASDLYLKPGDVVAVEQTARTQTRLFLASIVRMGLGVNAGATVSPN